MQTAQRLYEGVDLGSEGAVALITYMRTDSTRISEDALKDCRKHIKTTYGDAYLPDKANLYAASKDAQGAHEAIRPTDLSPRPNDMRRRLDPEQAKLYELIWTRTIASQMESAELERTTVDITAKAGARTLELRATGQVIKFDGFLALYQEGQDEDSEDE